MALNCQRLSRNAEERIVATAPLKPDLIALVMDLRLFFVDTGRLVKMALEAAAMGSGTWQEEGFKPEKTSIRRNN